MPTGDPFVHFELLSAKGESGSPLSVGDKPFVYILKSTYATDGSDQIIKDNLQHSADVLNGKVVRDVVKYPYVALDSDTGFGGVNHADSWVYLSPRNILPDVENIKTWMLKVANEFHSAKIHLDATANTAALYKIAWRASDIK